MTKSAPRLRPLGVLLTGVLLAGPAWGQETPSPAEPADSAAGQDVEGAGEDESEGAGDEATIRVECDLDCMVTIGLLPPRPLAADEVLTERIEPGAVRIKGHLSNIPEASTYEDVSLEAGGRQRVRLKIAKALEELRRIEARDRTYRDPESRLMWPTRDNGVDLVWQEAVEYCEELQHGGWEDWRLPTLDELEGIEAMWSMRPYKTADPITLTSCCAWSADRVDQDNAWNFNYRFRRPFRGHLGYSLSLRALCVRDGSDEIPENTRKNRRLAKREAKEKRREKLRRQAERLAAEEAARAAAQEESDDGSDGSDPEGGPDDPKGR